MMNWRRRTILCLIVLAGLTACGEDEPLAPVDQGTGSDGLEVTLKNAATAAESYATGNDGSYEGLDVAALEEEGLQPSSGTTVIGVDASFDSYCIEASDSAGTTAHFDSDDFQVEEGGC